MPRSQENKKRMPNDVDNLSNALKMIKESKYTTFGPYGCQFL